MFCPADLTMSSSGAKEGEDDVKKYDLWRRKFEEKSREMRAIEEPKIQRMNSSKLQSRATRLNWHISVEEAHSGGSRGHVKLLREYEETVNTQIMRNMQAGMYEHGNYCNSRREDQDL
jgi:hypothetical protein